MGFLTRPILEESTEVRCVSDLLNNFVDHFDEVHFAKSNDMVITPWMKDWVRDNTIDYVIKKDVNLNIRNSTFYRSYSKHFTEKTESPTKEMLGSSAPPETL